MWKEKIITTAIHYEKADIKEITLLTVKQAKKISIVSASCGEWWWLRSPGNNPSSAACIDFCGVYESGFDVKLDYVGVRPAFIIPNLEEANKIYVGKIPCTKIDKDLVLADKCVCKHKFDLISNNWKVSELRQYIESDDFWNKYIEEDE